MKRALNFLALLIFFLGLTACESDIANTDTEALYEAECATCNEIDDLDAECATCNEIDDLDAECATCNEIDD